MSESEELYLKLLAELRQKRLVESPAIQDILDRMRRELISVMRRAIDELSRLEIDREQPGAESRRNAETIMLSAIVQAMSGGAQ